MRKTSVSNGGGSFLLDVFDDEEYFTRLDQAELATGGFFDGRRIFAQAARGLAQKRIVSARALERSLERGIITASFQQSQQAFFAGNGVDDDDERDEEEDVTEQASAAVGQGRLRRRGGGSRWCVFALGHGLGELSRAGRSGSLPRR